MVEETITQIEARIKKAKSLNDERKKELLDLLSTLKTEVSQLSKTDAEDAQSIIGFTEVSIHEAIREEKNPKLLDLSLKGLSTSGPPQNWVLSWGLRQSISALTTGWRREGMLPSIPNRNSPEGISSTSHVLWKGWPFRRG